jgi:hypothetical protein
VKGSLFLFFFFFSLGDFAKQLNSKKIKKNKNLEGFLLPEMRKEKVKNRHVHIFGFHCVAKDIEG